MGLVTLTKDVKLLQKAVLAHKGQFLILQRAEKEYSRPLMWDLPGGNAEWPTATEDMVNPHLDDIYREIVEETALDLDREGYPVQLVYFRTYFESKKPMYSSILGWRIDLEDSFDRSQVELSHEHIDHSWISLEQFDEYDWGFAGDSDGFLREMTASAMEK